MTLRQYLKAASLRHTNTITHNPPLPHALYALRPRGVGGWCPSERCVSPRQHQHQLRRANKPREPGHGGGAAAVFAAPAAPEHRDGEMGDQKVSRSPRNRCLWWGEKQPVSGRSVTKEAGGDAAETRGVGGRGSRSCSTAGSFALIRLCAGEGLSFPRLRRLCDRCFGAAAAADRTGPDRGPRCSSSRINTHYTVLPC